jgi:hypothetical protein
MRCRRTCQKPHDKQMERSVTRHRVRGARAALHYALASRLMRQHAVAQLQRYASRIHGRIPGPEWL